MSKNLIIFRVVDADTSKRIDGAVIVAQNNVVGKFAGTTNSCGEFAAPDISPGHYEPVTITAPGYKEFIYPGGMDLADSGIITIGIKQDVVPITEPTRDQVCNVYCGFQGISILTKQYGWIPAFGPETSNLTDEDLISYCQQMRALKFTHIEFDISWRYSEPDYQYPVPGKDLSQNLTEVCRRLMIITNQGMLIKFSLAGDGLSNKERTYNDPVGWTYGHEWLMENLARILTALRNNPGRNLIKFTIFVPGYDGVFYGWGREGEVPDRQPERVVNFINLFRSLEPTGYLGLEHTTGNIPVGEGSTDWKTGGRLDAVDTVFSEFNPFNLHEDSSWQIIPRFTRPYIRPADQPAGDDPNPDFYLADCSRGKRFYIMYEIKTYRWVRGCSYQEVLEAALYLHAMAPNATICALLT